MTNTFIKGTQFVVEVDGRQVLIATATDIPGLFDVPGHGELTINQVYDLAMQIAFGSNQLTTSQTTLPKRKCAATITTAVNV